jgi:hypothetical protein
MADQRGRQSELIARVWSDEAFKARLKSDPKGALAEMGYKMPAHVEFEVLEATPTKQYLVIPPKPSGELSDADLENVAGGSTLGKADTLTATCC